MLRLNEDTAFCGGPVHRRGAENAEGAQRKYQQALLPFLFLSAKSPRSPRLCGELNIAFSPPLIRNRFEEVERQYQSIMNRLTVAIPYTEDKQFETLARQLIAHQLVEEALCLRQSATPSLPDGVKAVDVDAFFS